MGSKNILFLTLKIFSATGGIEKVCKIAGKVFYEFCRDNNTELSILSMHDNTANFDNRYFPKKCYRAFGADKFKFGISALFSAKKFRVVVLSHVNLLFFGYLLKLIHPNIKLVLLAHGIEVWKTFGKLKNRYLKKCDTIICVSNYTMQQMLKLHPVNDEQLIVINNCLDPFLQKLNHLGKSQELLHRYKLTTDNKIMLTLSRLSAHDRDKGYEKVLVALSILKDEFPELVYMIAGKYQKEEKEWIDTLIAQYKLENKVIITGYVNDSELADHLQLCDLYVMPSIKEGFGIIFIEALYFGKTVIAGNKDGSVDALANGRFGYLVDPGNQQQITATIRKVFNSTDHKLNNDKEVAEYFGYEKYKQSMLATLGLN